MKDIEYSSSAGERNVRPSWAVTDVDDQILGADAGRQKVKAGRLVVSELLELWVKRLLTSNLVPVNAHLSDRVDDKLQIRGGCCSFYFTGVEALLLIDD